MEPRRREEADEEETVMVPVKEMMLRCRLKLILANWSRRLLKSRLNIRLAFSRSINGTNMEVKIAAGYCVRKITVEECRGRNMRWIILDGVFNKHRTYIYGQVNCNVALVKKKAKKKEISPETNRGDGNEPSVNGMETGRLLERADADEPHCQSCNWYPLSWRTGIPQLFTQTELEAITNRFPPESIMKDEDGMQTYGGHFHGMPVVSCFSENDERFWSKLKILCQVRHRNIPNLVGYGFSGGMFLLFDLPPMGTLEENLRETSSFGDEAVKI
ncbi:hypothetical protein MLD38_026904 [Melastoma candidum]|uniref:Uncharacterized protein n=1 Tax=Melastoma candidum TaxID=119954 RepID=A0ACB9P141_9MYRT|nr:hypothetical protein MLD38_026904 [Melastoma candidum]